MKLKFNLLAAAVVAFAATGAQAQLSAVGAGTTASNSANGSLTFVALDSVGSPISFAANLDFNLLTFLPTSGVNTPGQTIVWNFGTNSVAVNGDARAASIGNYQYSTPFATLLGNAQSTELTWGVFAADGNGNAVAGANNAPRRNLATTGAPDANQLALITNAKITGATANIASLSTILNGSAAPNTIQAGVGAQTATSGTAYIGDTGGTALRTNYGGQFTFDYMVADQMASDFTLFTSGASGTIPGAITQYSTLGGDSTFKFDLQANTLTWQTAPVPEPSTFGMLVAGLAAIGAIARRRRSV